MYRNRSLVILLVVTAMIISASYLALRPATVEGVVDHKAITGTRDSTSHTLVTITDTEINVKDQEFATDFNASTIVDDTLAQKLYSWYDEIKYVLSARTSDGTMAYFTNREDFNKAQIGDRIRFEILRFKTTTIRIKKIFD